MKNNFNISPRVKWARQGYLYIWENLLNLASDEKKYSMRDMLINPDVRRHCEYVIPRTASDRFSWYLQYFYTTDEINVIIEEISRELLALAQQYQNSQQYIVDVLSGANTDIALSRQQHKYIRQQLHHHRQLGLDHTGELKKLSKNLYYNARCFFYKLNLIPEYRINKQRT